MPMIKLVDNFQLFTLVTVKARCYIPTDEWNWFFYALFAFDDKNLVILILLLPMTEKDFVVAIQSEAEQK